MRISYNWLRRYIDLNISAIELSEKLTSLGLEVESIDDLGRKFEGFLIGEVLDVQKHPNADRLKVCTVHVSTDKKSLQIVCGAPNVESGQKVIVGLVGATVPHNQHDPSGQPFLLTKVKIRGVESSGMICSEKELGIGEDAEGIKVLESTAKVGTSLADHLGFNDVAFEIGITPNRPDCLSHIGVARDLAASYGLQLSLPKFKLVENKKAFIKKLATVTLDNSEDCPRYTARIIQNVKIQDSPDWLKQLLHAVGLRPINNVVDATNFVMYEYGQPLHAFDYDHLADHSIVVRSAWKEEKFTTLDGKEHTLDGTELMIADGKKSVAIGGVMGGMNSEISSTTTSVLLESAYFSPTSIRKTAKRLGFSTDASYRFERGIDPNITVEASNRAAGLIAELSGGTVVSGCIDAYPKKIAKKNILLRRDRLNAMLGTVLTSKEIAKYLTALNFSPSPGKEKNSFKCSIPTFRPDIEQEIDLIEEVARLHGYDNIENKLSSEVMFSSPDHRERRKMSIRQWCESNGMNEIVTNSLIGADLASAFSTTVVSVRNPISEELETLRPSLLSTMLQTVSFNINHGSSSLRFYEIGTVFSSSQDEKNLVQGYSEKDVLGICLSGDANTVSWNEQVRKVDIFDMKGVVLSLLRGIGLDNSDLIYYNASTSLTEMSLGVEINGTYVGSIGRCKPDILKKYKIDQEVYYAELFLKEIVEFDAQKKYSVFSKFPTVVRDVAFVMKKHIPVLDVQKAIQQAGGTTVKEINLFDIFEGSGVGEGNKSVAFSLNLNSMEKTLNDKEIETIISSIVKTVTQSFNATLRSL